MENVAKEYKMKLLNMASNFRALPACSSAEVIRNRRRVFVTEIATWWIVDQRTLQVTSPKKKPEAVNPQFLSPSHKLEDLPLAPGEDHIDGRKKPKVLFSGASLYITR